MTHTQDLDAGETLIFDKTILNVGATLNNNNTLFTCTVPGLYAFHFYALTDVGDELWLSLYKNNNDLLSTAYSHSPSSTGYGDAGNSAIVDLNVGDTVSVRAHDAFHNAIYGASDEIYTTFSGVLIDSGMVGKTFFVNEHLISIQKINI